MAPEVREALLPARQEDTLDSQKTGRPASKKVAFFFFF